MESPRVPLRQKKNKIMKTRQKKKKCKHFKRSHTFHATARGGGDQYAAAFKEDEGLFGLISPKLSTYASNITNFAKEKGLRLIGLQSIPPDDEAAAAAAAAAADEKPLSAEDAHRLKEFKTIENAIGNIVSDTVKSTSNVLRDVNAKISTPEFKKEAEFALDNAAEIATMGVRAFEQPLNESIDVLSESGEKLVAGVSSGAIKVMTDVAAAVPYVGTVVELGKIANDASATIADVMDATSSATKAVSTVIQKTNSNFEQNMNELKAAKEMKAASLPTMSLPTMPKPPTVSTTALPTAASAAAAAVPRIKGGGSSSSSSSSSKKKIEKQVAGRIKDSIYEFTAPTPLNMTSSMKKTKKQKYGARNRMKSKRVRFNF